MIRVTEKYFERRVNDNGFSHERQQVLRTTTWFLWIIPVYSREQILERSKYTKKWFAYWITNKNQVLFKFWRV